MQAIQNLTPKSKIYLCLWAHEVHAGNVQVKKLALSLRTVDAGEIVLSYTNQIVSRRTTNMVSIHISESRRENKIKTVKRL